MLSEEYPWFALRVKACREKYVAANLRHKGLTEFLPVYRAMRNWSDRRKEIELSLFPGYLFCKFDPEVRVPVLTTPGVTSIVGIGKIPMPVQQSEIDAIQAVVDSGLNAGPWPFIAAGQQVRIEEGPLRGVEGVLVEVNHQNRLVVSVTLLQRGVAVDIERRWVRPISPQFPQAATFPHPAVLAERSSHMASLPA